MCGCERHFTAGAPCTCHCPSHAGLVVDVSPRSQVVNAYGPDDGSIRIARNVLLWLSEVSTDGVLRDQIAAVRSTLADCIEAHGGEL